MLWLALNLPALPLEALTRGRPTVSPLAIVSEPSTNARVVACDRRAEALGVTPGMTITTALAMAPAARIQVRNDGQERAALHGVARWATQITSSVSLQPPRGLLLEVGASLKLFGGLEVLLERVRRGLRELGYQGRLACAPTPLAAMLLAPGDETPTITERRELHRRLDALPVDRLELTAETLGVLNDIGVDTLGDCRRLPRDGLSRRCGPVLPATLDKAYGVTPDPRPLFVPPPRFVSGLELTDEVSEAAAVLFACRRLLVELAGFLAGRDGAASMLRFTLHHPRQPPTPVTLGLVEPSRDAQHLTDLLREQLTNLILTAPVRAVGLRVDEIKPWTPRSGALFGDRGRAAANPALLLERLRARLGPAAVRGVRIVPDHRPELAWDYRTDGDTTPMATTDFASTRASTRPLWLLEQPCPLETAAGNPRLNDALLRSRDGPERIETGWWDGRGVTRDYYIAQAGGARFWIFRDRKGLYRWWLHGIFA